MGLPCGGRLELLVEELPGAQPVEALLAAWEPAVWWHGGCA